MKILLGVPVSAMTSWALLVATTALFAMAHGQPSTCTVDSQCYSDHFCMTAVSACKSCLHCEDLKREAPAFLTTCIKSVAECGPCLPGLIVDHRGEMDVTASPCVPAAGGSVPVYIWCIVALVVLGFVVIILIIVYVLKRNDSFRIYQATWLRSSCAAPETAATAPEPPPPYNPYSPVRPESPYSLPDATYPQADLESSSPFIKRAPSQHGNGAREAAGNQNARVYSPPAYVRVDPQSPASPLREDDAEVWPAIHNEDTTPHDWTPDTTTSDNNGNPPVGESVAIAIPEMSPSENTASDLPTLLAAARDTTLVAPPPKKLKTQDNNNNGGRGTSSGDSGDAAPGIGLASARAPDAPSIYFNFVQINNTKL